MSLVGMWVCFDVDDEHFQVGEITKQISESYYLVRIDCRDKSIPDEIRLYSIREMESRHSEKSASVLGGFIFFHTEVELRAFIDWLNKDNTPNVIQGKFGQ